MSKYILLIGGGGHCNSVIDVIESEGIYSIMGILDSKEKIGQKILGHEIIGSDDDIEEFLKICKNFHVTIGHIKNNNKRQFLFYKVKELGGNFPTIIASTAYVSKYSNIAEGTIVMHNVTINSNVKIGVNCILNTSSVIEHDSIIENHCHISTGAFINGECRIGENSFIGSNATVIQSITIGKKNLIAAGSVVIKNTQANETYVGNPARLLK